jgi:MFS transporter, AAHS family, 4-hydroxybenzoate transporter
LAFGRLGAVLSFFAGVAVITASGSSVYLSMLGMAMALALVGLMLLRRHIPGTGALNATGSGAALTPR